jgi:cytochrome P450
LESHFDFPQEFRPERWLEREARTDVYIPFLAGPLGCLGKKCVATSMPQTKGSLTILELRSFIARVIWEFDLELPADLKEPEYKFGFVHHMKEMYMKVAKR